MFVRFLKRPKVLAAGSFLVKRAGWKRAGWHPKQANERKCYSYMLKHFTIANKTHNNCNKDINFLPTCNHPIPCTCSRNNYQQRSFFSKTKVKYDKKDDDFDAKEMVNLIDSLKEDQQTEEIREMKFPGVQRGEKMVIIFTCTVCNTRTGKTISKIAYEKGVVIARCPGCENLHLVADRLNYFGDGNWDIEKFLNERGEDIKLIDSDDKLLQIQMTDIVGGHDDEKK